MKNKPIVVSEVKLFSDFPNHADDLIIKLNALETGRIDDRPEQAKKAVKVVEQVTGLRFAHAEHCGNRIGFRFYLM